jgi:hypothetical protein
MNDCYDWELVKLLKIQLSGKCIKYLIKKATSSGNMVPFGII